MTTFLQQLKTYCLLDKSVTHGTYLDYHFEITIPTYWDHGIQEGLIHTIFIPAGLINEDETSRQIIIFTQLES